MRQGAFASSVKLPSRPDTVHTLYKGNGILKSSCGRALTTESDDSGGIDGAAQSATVAEKQRACPKRHALNH